MLKRTTYNLDSADFAYYDIVTTYTLVFLLKFVFCICY